MPQGDTDFVLGTPISSAPPAPKQGGLGAAVDSGFQLGAPSSQQAQNLPQTEEEWAKMPAGQVVGLALQNAPESAVRFGKSMVEPFMHPQETASALGELGKGAYSKVQGAFGVEQDPTEKAQKEAAIDAAGQALKEQYGSIGGWKKSFATRPVETFGDISIPFTGGETLLAKAPGILGEAGKLSGKVGAMTDPIRVAAKAPELAATAATNLTAIPFWFKSGSSYPALQEAAKAGMTGNEHFWNHWAGVAQPGELVDSVQGAVKTAQDTRRAEYMKGMKDQSKFVQPLDYDLINNQIGKIRADNTTVGGMPKNTGVHQALDEVEKLVGQWQAQPNVQGAHSITDMDALKRRVDELRSMYPKGSPEEAVLTGVRQSIYKTIEGQDSGYAKIMQDYGEASDQLRDFKKTLGAGQNTATAASVQKLIKAQSKGASKNLLDEIAKIDPSIPARIAGTELHELMPQGLRGYLGTLGGQMGISGMLGSLFHPAALASLLGSSPRVAGGVQYGLGTVLGRPGQALQALETRVPATPRALSYGAGRAEEQQNPNQQSAGGRIGRASGGSVVSANKADQLIKAAESAKKAINSRTEVLLDQPDEKIAGALAIAKRHI